MAAIDCGRTCSAVANALVEDAPSFHSRVSAAERKEARRIRRDGTGEFDTESDDESEEDDS